MHRFFLEGVYAHARDAEYIFTQTPRGLQNGMENGTILELWVRNINEGKNRLTSSIDGSRFQAQPRNSPMLSYKNQ